MPALPRRLRVAEAHAGDLPAAADAGRARIPGCVRQNRHPRVPRPTLTSQQVAERSPFEPGAGAARGIEIESLSTTLVGDIDLQGLLALGDVQAGYQGIRIEMDIRAKNASDADLDDLLQCARAQSPVGNTVCRPVPVVVERVKRTKREGVDRTAANEAAQA
jgi:hypothetical protein